MIQQMIAIFSLVLLPFLKPAWTSGSSRFTYCWSLAWRILSITLLALCWGYPILHFWWVSVRSVRCTSGSLVVLKCTLLWCYLFGYQLREGKTSSITVLILKIDVSFWNNGPVPPEKTKQNKEVRTIAKNKTKTKNRDIYSWYKMVNDAWSLSRVWLFVNPWTIAYPSPLSMRSLQARILEWVSMPFSR